MSVIPPSQDKIFSNSNNITDTVEEIMIDAEAQATPPLVVFIVYDAPNRDCAAKASNGEICCTYQTDGTCAWVPRLTSQSVLVKVAENRFRKITPIVICERYAAHIARLQPASRYTAGGNCATGLSEYENEYIQPFASVLARFNGKVSSRRWSEI